MYISSTYRYVYATVYKGYSYFRVAPECRRGNASRITFLSWCACFFFFSFSFRNTKTDGWTPHPSLDDGRKKASADEFHFKPLHLVPLSLSLFLHLPCDRICDLRARISWFVLDFSKDSCSDDDLVTCARYSPSYMCLRPTLSRLKLPTGVNVGRDDLYSLRYRSDFKEPQW